MICTIALESDILEKIDYEYMIEENFISKNTKRMLFK